MLSFPIMLDIWVHGYADIWICNMILSIVFGYINFIYPTKEEINLNKNHTPITIGDNSNCHVQVII